MCGEDTMKCFFVFGLFVRNFVFVRMLAKLFEHQPLFRPCEFAHLPIDVRFVGPIGIMTFSGWKQTLHVTGFNCGALKEHGLEHVFNSGGRAPSIQSPVKCASPV